MDLSKFKDGKVHLGNSEVKGLKYTIDYRSPPGTYKQTDPVSVPHSSSAFIISQVGIELLHDPG